MKFCGAFHGAPIMCRFEARAALAIVCDALPEHDASVLWRCADDQVRLGDALCAVVDRVPLPVRRKIGALLATLEAWHKRRPDVALDVLLRCAAGEPLCAGVASVANVAGARGVEAHATNAARAMHIVLSREPPLRVAALRALTGLARAAPRTLVPVWQLLLPRVLQIARVGVVEERAAAVECLAVLLVGGSQLLGRKRAAGSMAFTSTAEYVHRYCVDAASIVAQGVGSEADHAVLMKLVKAAAVVGALALPREECEILLSALFERVQSDQELVVSGLKAIANVLGARNEGVGRDILVRVAQYVVDLLSERSLVGVEEALIVLQAMCEYRVSVMSKLWGLLEPQLIRLTTGERNVIALHATRVGVKFVTACSDLDGVDPGRLLNAYHKLASHGHRHGFHAIRTEAALAAEAVIRMPQAKHHDLYVAARNELLLAAEKDAVVSVRSVAVRALAAVSFDKDDCEVADLIVSRLYGILASEDRPKVLQSRCAWSLATIVDKALGVFRTFENSLLEYVQNFELYATRSLRERVEALECGESKIRSSDNDTCATGFVRLIAATFRYQCANNLTVRNETLECMCAVVRCDREAPKTRWNACTALGDVLHARIDSSAVNVLVDACATANTVKIRTAAARALQPSASHLGVPACVELFNAARQISGAPRDAVEACTIATAALVHDSLANANSNPAGVSQNPQCLVDAIAVHTQLPSYVLNPRAKLPPSTSDADSPRAAIAALPTLSIRALSAVVVVAELDPQFKVLAEHLRSVLEVKDVCIVDKYDEVGR